MRHATILNRTESIIIDAVVFYNPHHVKVSMNYAVNYNKWRQWANQFDWLQSLVNSITLLKYYVQFSTARHQSLIVYNHNLEIAELITEALNNVKCRR